jgi:cobalt-zinc-cadmium efflux system protein
MHAHRHAYPSTSRVLGVSLFITAGYILITLIAGLRAHSLALLSEAGHNLSDFLALLLSWVALYVQTLQPTDTKTYGYHRAGVLAAFVNALTLVVVCIFIFIEAFHRLQRPVVVRAGVMVWVAAAGVLMNGLIAAMLHGKSHDVNVRSAFIHMLGDTLSTASVILGGVAIYFTGRNWIDPALSFAIGALILWSSFGIIRETLNILLEGMPRGLKMDQVTAEIARIAGVRDVHDLHIWSIGSEVHALSCHISIEDIPPSASERILRDVNERLRTQFNILHTTIQFEHLECDIAHGCIMPVSLEQAHHREQPHPHNQ